MLSSRGGQSRIPSCKTAVRYTRDLVGWADNSSSVLKLDQISWTRVVISFGWVMRMWIVPANTAVSVSLPATLTAMELAIIYASDMLVFGDDLLCESM
jgi:hypothetical protein